MSSLSPHPTASPWRRAAEAALVSVALVALPACGSNVERVPVVQFTEGVETELTEVAPDDWRIADERVLPDSNATRVIATGLDGVADTFALAELTGARVAGESVPDSTEQRRYRRRTFFSPILLYGLIGNRLGGYRSGFTPNPSAYVDRGTYNRVQNTAGTRLQSSARRTTVTRPSSGRSGFGSGRSGRSFGG